MLLNHYIRNKKRSANGNDGMEVVLLEGTL